MLKIMASILQNETLLHAAPLPEPLSDAEANCSLIPAECMLSNFGGISMAQTEWKFFLISLKMLAYLLSDVHWAEPSMIQCDREQAGESELPQNWYSAGEQLIFTPFTLLSLKVLPLNWSHL